MISHMSTTPAKLPPSCLSEKIEKSTPQKKTKQGFSGKFAALARTGGKKCQNPQFVVTYSKPDIEEENDECAA